MGKESLC